MENFDKCYFKSKYIVIIFIFILSVFPFVVHANSTDIPDKNGEQGKQPHMNYYVFDEEIINRIWEVPFEKYFNIEFISIHLTQLSGAFGPIVSLSVDNSAKIVFPLEIMSSGGSIDRYMFSEKILMFAWNTVFIQSNVSLSGSVLISGYLFNSQ